MRKAKIVCTLGPSSATADAIGKLMDAGMNVARLNFSHGDHESHRRIFGLVRAAARERGRARDIWDTAADLLAELEGDG